MLDSAEAPSRAARRWRFVAGALALLLLGLGEFVALVLAVFGAAGAGLSFFAAPIALLVRTPQSWAWIGSIAAMLALAPVFSIAQMLLFTPRGDGIARRCCRDGEWFDVVPPTVLDVASMCAIVGGILLAANFAALALWKRGAFGPTRTAS